MAHLIIATNASLAGMLKLAKAADQTLIMEPRLVAGPLLSNADTIRFFGKEKTAPQSNGNATHWTTYNSVDYDGDFLDHCRHFDDVTIWSDSNPNDQIVLVWLLNFLIGDLRFTRPISVQQGNSTSDRNLEELGAYQKSIRLVDSRFGPEIQKTWKVLQSKDPTLWLTLVNRPELELLTSLQAAILKVLGEFPNAFTSLGATETKILNALAVSEKNFFQLMEELTQHNSVSVYDGIETAKILDELISCDRPPISTRGTVFSKGKPLHQRGGEIFLLNDFGRSLVERQIDFSLFNRIDKHMLNVRITNSELWRWDNARVAFAD